MKNKYPVRVFVYGTLMEGLHNHPLMDKVRDKPEPAILEGYAMQYSQYLDDTHRYAQIPVIYPKKDCFVLGEIYEINNIERIDILEVGYDREYCPDLNAFFYCSDKSYNDLYDAQPDRDNLYDFRKVICDEYTGGVECC